MGCDIHMTYQKISKSQQREEKLSTILETESEVLEDEWVIIDDGPTTSGYGNYQFSAENRNYHWFGRMSEVRGDGPRISEVGYPEGVYLENDHGDHSHSHVYLNTLLEEEWSDEDKSAMRFFINDEIPRMVKYCDDNGLKYNEFRILMSYDS